jgi:multidrug efflux system membrane fusion protein
MARLVPAALLAALVLGAAPALAGEWTVTAQQVDDRKAVIATVEPMHELVARTRIAGTLATLTVKEGDRVAAGDRIAVVADQKLLLQIEALKSRIQAQQAERDQAQTDFDRSQKLRAAGVVSQAQFDQARTRLDVAERTLQALRSDRQVVEQQSSEGAVLAPGPGRVLTVPVTEGSVVTAGETIATFAADNYVLRLQLPERHARSIKTGDTILIGARGLQGPDEDDETLRQGHVALVYPQIDRGRVIADVRVDGIGDYFVGERMRVYVTTGTRTALIVPANCVYRRFGVSYVKLKDGTEVVVQVGEPVDNGIEILAGLHPNDVVTTP